MKLQTLLIGASFSFLVGCSGVVTVTTQDLIAYSEKFQARAAAEKKLLPPPCHRQSPSQDCSTLNTLIGDYHLMRNRVRETQ